MNIYESKPYHKIKTICMTRQVKLFNFSSIIQEYSKKTLMKEISCLLFHSASTHIAYEFMPQNKEVLNSLCGADWE